MGDKLSCGIRQLQRQFSALDWTLHTVESKGSQEKVYHWPGDPAEDILICIHQSQGQAEPFHRHDFFYFNYTYQGQYDSLSYQYNHRITIGEKELYAGQPYAGHALFVHDNQQTIIVGVLIQKGTFFRSFLPMLSCRPKLFQFFLGPSANGHANEFIHIPIPAESPIRPLLELMILEYASPSADTQDMLRSLALAFLLQVARQYEELQPSSVPTRLSDQVVQYMGQHSDSVTLQELGRHFSYHPNYISTLLHRELGRSFSQILLELRMERAVSLLRGTDLPISEIALMVGYSSNSNFYKAFRAYFHASPREYMASGGSSPP